MWRSTFQPYWDLTTLSSDAVWSKWICLYIFPFFFFFFFYLGLPKDFQAMCAIRWLVWCMHTCGPRETKAYSFLALARGLGYRTLPPSLWWWDHRLLEGIRGSLWPGWRDYVTCAGERAEVQALYFLLSKGVEWSRFHSDRRGLHSLFQTKSRDESGFTKAGGLMYMYRIRSINRPYDALE